MYKVINKEVETEFANLDLAMAFAKELNVFVSIQGGEFEIVGIFGVDSIKELNTIGTRPHVSAVLKRREYNETCN